MDETSPNPGPPAHVWNVLIALFATATAFYIPLTQVSGFMGRGSPAAAEGLLTVLFGLDFAAQLSRSRELPPAKRRGPPVAGGA